MLVRFTLTDGKACAIRSSSVASVEVTIQGTIIRLTGGDYVIVREDFETVLKQLDDWHKLFYGE